MKKLNNAEISALANKIYAELYAKKSSNAYDLALETFKKTADYKTLDKIIKKYNVEQNSYTRYFITAIVSINFQKPQPVVKTYSVEQIRNEIILAQIEASDLKTLIEIVKKNLK